MSQEDEEECEEWDDDCDFTVSKLVQRTQEIRPEIESKKQNKQ